MMTGTEDDPPEIWGTIFSPPRGTLNASFYSTFFSGDSMLATYRKFEPSPKIGHW